jgi:hypothetical protein
MHGTGNKPNPVNHHDQTDTHDGKINDFVTDFFHQWGESVIEQGNIQMQAFLDPNGNTDKAEHNHEQHGYLFRPGYALVQNVSEKDLDTDNHNHGEQEYLGHEQIDFHD